MKGMDELLCSVLWGQLQSMGLFTEKNPVITDLKIKTGLIDLYDRWLEESIAVLTRMNYLRNNGGSCSVIDTTPIDMDDAWQKWDRQKGSWLEDSDLKAKVVLVEATLRALPEILTGKRLATDIMFPNSSMELVEGIYKNNLIADYFNNVLADTIVSYIQERIEQDSSAHIRIIEIGAGTGGTSVVVFRKLATYQVHIREYCYTDISKAFLSYAEKEYGPENPYLTYKKFNVEAPIAGQGISAGEYDIVIATNVLHATKNIRQTLRNTKATLKKNGLILLNEISNNSIFTHLTFGLLEGWWLYEDPVLRIPGCPGLYSQTWQTVLESEGFWSVIFPAKEDHALGQQIIIAESDGIVRQKRQQVNANKPNEIFTGKRTKTKASQLYDKTLQSYIDQDIFRPLPKTNTVVSSIEVLDQMAEDYVKEIIIEKLSESLRVDANLIDIDESFANYGVDSIIGVHLVQVINQALMFELETTSIFDYNSVNQLTTYILSKYKNIITKALGQNIKQVDIKNDLRSIADKYCELPKATAVPSNINVTGQMIENHIKEIIIEKISESLKVDTSLIDIDESFMNYGVDSITGVHLVQVINQALMIELETTSIFDYSSVNQLTTYVLSKFKDVITKILGEKIIKQIDINNDFTYDNLEKHPVYSYSGPFQRRVLTESNIKEKEKSTMNSIPTIHTQFPELVHLNQSSQGQPVFWFHGGVGGVEIYQSIAQKSLRPFYGIQARGWMTDRFPLQGIAAMAAYYIHIIQSVQPEGPYDLGGFSLGGILAYEVTRQLQELGQTVDTILMLDSPYKWLDGEFPRHTSILQAVNLALISSIFQEPEKFAQTLIHRKKVDLNADDEMLIKQLIVLAKSRGLTKSEAHLHSLIESTIKLQHAYEIHRFTVLPLVNPQKVTCFYFRAMHGLLYGELEPYFSAVEEPFLFDQTNYWEGWEQYLPNIHVMDVNASNHMVILSESKVYKTIFELCERLYSEEGISTEFLKSFKMKTKKIHGSKVINSSGMKGN